jgi:hypothetical protein
MSGSRPLKATKPANGLIVTEYLGPPRNAEYLGPPRNIDTATPTHRKRVLRLLRGTSGLPNLPRVRAYGELRNHLVPTSTSDPEIVETPRDTREHGRPRTETKRQNTFAVPQREILNV